MINQENFEDVLPSSFKYIASRRMLFLVHANKASIFIRSYQHDVAAMIVRANCRQV